MDIVHRNISGFFDELLADLNCRNDTKAYIVSIFGKYKTAELDFSKDSLTLLFCQAREKEDFFTYQKLGDWIFYIDTLAPEHLRFASRDYYTTLAQNSYYSCYRMTNRQWKCYEELADNFLILEEEVKKRLPALSTQIVQGTYIDPYGS
jgi:hypothetical protein